MQDIQWFLQSESVRITALLIISLTTLYVFLMMIFAILINLYPVELPQ